MYFPLSKMLLPKSPSLVARPLPVIFTTFSSDHLSGQRLQTPSTFRDLAPAPPQLHVLPLHIRSSDDCFLLQPSSHTKVRDSEHLVLHPFPHSLRYEHQLERLHLKEIVRSIKDCRKTELVHIQSHTAESCTGVSGQLQREVIKT